MTLEQKCEHLKIMDAYHPMHLRHSIQQCNEEGCDQEFKSKLEFDLLPALRQNCKFHHPVAPKKDEL
jgi:hypothetical protein